jgi:mRNA interferase RelE/StbE
MFKVIYTTNFKNRYFDNLSKFEKIKIRKFIQEKLCFEPHFFGEPLKGNLLGLWKARIGNYRIIYQIKTEEIIIIIIKINHRKDVYK